MKAFDAPKDASKVPPYRAVIFALVCSFFVFLFLDQLEQCIVDSGIKFNLRFCHFVRGFLSTFAGMNLVWWIMNRKEKELVKWRDHFAGELESRTAELGSTIEARIEDASRLRAVLDSVAQGIIELNQLGLIRSVNRTAVQILEMPEENLLGRHVDFLTSKLRLYDAVAGSEAEIDAQDLIAGDGHREFKYFAPDGTVHILVWKSAPIKNGERSFGVVVAVSDVSERRRLQAALLQQRDDFVAVIKHRLQINIFALKRVIRLILDQVFGELKTEQQKTISLLADTVDDTETVLDMLVDIYMYKNRQKQLNSVLLNLSNLLQELSAELEKSYPGKNIVLSDSVLEGISFSGDAKALKKLFKHLLSNGLKFARSKVRVEMDSEKQELKLKLSDDGPGIAQEDLPDIFDRFFKESASGKHVPVTGLGLCLCHEIVRAHNGTIVCRSNDGSGTSFEVVLPKLRQELVAQR